MLVMLHRSKMMRHNEIATKIAVTAIAAVALVIRFVFPNVTIDGVALGLIVVAVLPWLASLIKAAEFPGGWKIEFQDVADAAERAVGSASAVPSASKQERSFVVMADDDPNLALVKLRIEIERRLRALAARYGLVASRPLPTVIDDLQGNGYLPAETASGLRDLVILGNRAAHGVPVSPRAAMSAITFAPGILGVLDEKLAK